MNIIETQGEGFSSIDYVHQCLIDKDKAHAFEQTMKEIMKPSFHVLELGTGTGILSLLAARTGAAKITAVEYDPFIAEVARKNIKQNGREDKISVEVADARTVSFPEDKKFDVVVMEMLCTGLVEEMQVQAINNLVSKKIISHETIVIPAAQENYISLAHTDFMIHGFDMRMIKYLWITYMENKTKALSNDELLNHIDFRKAIKENFFETMQFTIRDSGLINSVLLSSKVLLNATGSISLGSTFSLSPLVAIPLSERMVKAGDKITLLINYKLGGGFQNFKVDYSTS